MAMCLSLLGTSLAEDQSASEEEISAAESVEAESSAAEGVEAESDGEKSDEQSAEQSDEAAAPEVMPQEEDSEDSDDDEPENPTYDPEDDTVDPDVPREGTCGTNIKWRMDRKEKFLFLERVDDNIPAAMDNYEDIEDCPWYPFRQKITKVTVYGGISNVGDFAFSDLPNLTDVYIDAGLSVIGAYAFAFDESLSYITNVRSVQSIGERAFSQCPKLTTIEGGGWIPQNVRTIGDYAFAESGITEFNANWKSLRTIGEGAFSDCDNLSSIKFDEVSPVKIGSGAFEGCMKLANQTITFPRSVISIEDDAFSDGENGDIPITVKSYVGTAGYYFAMNRKLPFITMTQSLDSDLVKISVKEHAYTGKVINPTVEVLCGTFKLEEGTHYTVNGGSGTRPGKYNLTVTGIKDSGFEGSRTETHAIIIPCPKLMRARWRAKKLQINLGSKPMEGTHCYAQVKDSKNRTHTCTMKAKGTNNRVLESTKQNYTGKYVKIYFTLEIGKGGRKKHTNLPFIRPITGRK